MIQDRYLILYSSHVMSWMQTARTRAGTQAVLWNRRDLEYVTIWDMKTQTVRNLYTLDPD